MAWEENLRICLHMQLIAILSRTEVYKTCLLFFRTNPLVLTQIKSKIQQETDLSIILLYFYN